MRQDNDQREPMCDSRNKDLSHQKLPIWCRPLGSRMVIAVPKVRILVADDIELWREYVSSMLQNEPSFEVICQVVDGPEAVFAAKRHQPTIALLDIGLPGLCGIDAARSIRALAQNTRIVFFSGQQDPEIIEAALSLGGGYVLKSDAASDLIPAIHTVARGGRFISRQLAGLGITSERKRS
jgi:DNA-binding NarL/FixJ family response regulator